MINDMESYDKNVPSLLEEVDRIFGDVPDEVWDQLPTDLSVNHDHYIYGLPKRWNPETGKWFDEEGENGEDV